MDGEKRYLRIRKKINKEMSCNESESLKYESQRINIGDSGFIWV